MLQVCRVLITAIYGQLMSAAKPNFQYAREIVQLNTLGTHEPLVLQVKF